MNKVNEYKINVMNEAYIMYAYNK